MQHLFLVADYYKENVAYAINLKIHTNHEIIYYSHQISSTRQPKLITVRIHHGTICYSLYKIYLSLKTYHTKQLLNGLHRLMSSLIVLYQYLVICVKFSKVNKGQSN